MIDQFDSYPSVGYQQQNYVVCQEGMYPPSGYRTNGRGMMGLSAPPPSNNHFTAQGGYAKPQEGWWSGTNKQHNEWAGKNHEHQNHGYNTGHSGYAQPHEGWSGKNKHQNDWSGKPDRYSQGYNSHRGVTDGGYGTYSEGYSPAMQPVGYGLSMQAVAYECSSTYEGQCPSTRYQKVEYWGGKDIED